MSNDGNVIVGNTPESGAFTWTDPVHAHSHTSANLLKLVPALWTSLDNAAVLPTNNDAERALRALVLKRKISGPSRCMRGDEFIARGFSVYETCRRQGQDFWDYMHLAVVAWIDKATAPTLLPAGPAASPSDKPPLPLPPGRRLRRVL